MFFQSVDVDVACHFNTLPGCHAARGHSSVFSDSREKAFSICLLSRLLDLRADHIYFIGEYQHHIL